MCIRDRLGNNTLGDNRDKDGNYMSQSMFAQTNYVLGRTVVNGLSQTAIANADLTWETTYITNIGVDYGLCIFCIYFVQPMIDGKIGIV